MDKRRASGIFALLVLAAATVALFYFANRSDRGPTTAFAPAESADESTAPPDVAATTEAPVATEPSMAAEVAAAPETPAAATGPAASETVAEAPAALEAVVPELDAAGTMAAEGTAPPAEAEIEVAIAAPGAEAAASARETAAPVTVAPETVPSFDIVRVEPTGEAVIAGRAEALATVEILDGVESIGTGQASDRGEWVITLEEPLPPGAHDLAVRTTSPDRTVAILSDQRVTVSVPEAGEDVLVVLNDPDEASRVLQVPEAATPAEADVAAAEPPTNADGVATTPVEAATPNEQVAAAAISEPPSDRETLPEPGAASGDGTDVAALEPATKASDTEKPADPATAEAASDPAAPAAQEEADVAAAPTEPQAGTEQAEVAVAPTEPDAADEAEVAEATTEQSAGDEVEVAALPEEPVVPVEPPPPEPAVVVAAVEADTAGTLYIAGTAATGETVRVYLDGDALGDAKPSPSGTWLLETTRDMPAGNYVVRADQVGSGGDVIARSEVPFEREVEVASLKPTAVASSSEGAAVSVAMPEMETVIIKRGDNLWRIARSSWGKGIRWSTIYQANDDQIRDPDMIYPGQVFIMPKGDTSWVEEN